MIKAVSLVFLAVSAAVAQPQIGNTNLNAGWLWPKGVYTLVIHDGPGPRTEDLAKLLAGEGIVADFFQTLCHYSGQPWADTRSAMCFQPHVTPVASANRLLALHQCLGNHGQDHLDTPTLNQADTIYQIGGPTSFLLPYWEQQNCPALVTFPGFQTDPQHTAWLNQDTATAGRQQGPVWADFDGSGTLPLASGAIVVGNDQDCFSKGGNQQQCQALMLGAMAQAGHGGVVNVHDFNPYAKIPTNTTDIKSSYVYDYVAGILQGCQALNGGKPCVWLPPDAIPGIHRQASAGQFTPISSVADDFSDRIGDLVVADINNDSFADVVVPRNDGLYCGLNAGNGTLYGLQRCLNFANGAPSKRYWVVDVENDRLPYAIWLGTAGLMGAKANGHGGFGPEVRNLSTHFSQVNLLTAGVYRDSLRFGAMQPGGLPEVVAMTSSGVATAANNGGGFGVLRMVAHLAYDASANSAWSPEAAADRMVLADLSGDGTMSIVIPGNSGLLYATGTKSGFASFKTLAMGDGFNQWNAPQTYTALSATRIAGRPSIAAWTATGIATSNFKVNDRKPVVEQFQFLCSDCFASLPGWLDQWQQSNMTAMPFQAGFADFQNSGVDQAFAVFQKSLFVFTVNNLPGYY